MMFRKVRLCRLFHTWKGKMVLCQVAIFFLVALFVNGSFAQSGLNTNDKRLEMNVRLYAIFCEDGKHPSRTKACEALFVKILSELWGHNKYVNDEQLENAVRSYKRLYEFLD